MNSVEQLDTTKKKTDLPVMKPGMTVRVHQKISEGEKERVQIFEGMIIAMSGGTRLTATITVRKIASGVGVERIFPVHSKMVTKIEPVKQAKVRRSKLFYTRTSKKRLQENKIG